jgi:type II secretory pathway pseudopilin PulG
LPSGERRGPQGGTRRARGFTYLGVLVLVMLLGLALAAAGEVASTVARRDREEQLLWVGHQYRAAIGRYYLRRHAFPQALADLLGSSPDDPVPVRYLRRLYPDPMTSAVDWVLVQGPDGGIMGVASSSPRTPLKTAGFVEAEKDFENAVTYGDWKFTFLPGRFYRPAVPSATSP